MSIFISKYLFIYICIYIYIYIYLMMIGNDSIFLYLVCVI